MVISILGGNYDCKECCFSGLWTYRNRQHSCAEKSCPRTQITEWLVIEVASGDHPVPPSLCKADSSRAGCTGPCPDRAGVCGEKEILQLLWAARSHTWDPHSEEAFPVLQFWLIALVLSVKTTEMNLLPFPSAYSSMTITFYPICTQGSFG